MIYYHTANLSSAIIVLNFCCSPSIKVLFLFVVFCVPTCFWDRYFLFWRENCKTSVHVLNPSTMKKKHYVVPSNPPVVLISAPPPTENNPLPESNDTTAASLMSRGEGGGLDDFSNFPQFCWCNVRMGWGFSDFSRFPLLCCSSCNAPSGWRSVNIGKDVTSVTSFIFQQSPLLRDLCNVHNGRVISRALTVSMSWAAICTTDAVVSTFASAIGTFMFLFFVPCQGGRGI